jgi:hypothetical protein
MFDGIKPGYADKPHAASSAFTARFSSHYLNVASTLKNNGSDFLFPASHVWWCAT